MSDRIELGESGLVIWDDGWTYNKATETWVDPYGNETKNPPVEHLNEII